MKGKVKNIILWTITAIIAISASIYGISNYVSVNADETIDGKELIDNHDGTYRLELSVTGSAEPITETIANVNVLIVYDRSSSMTMHDTPDGTARRADATESIVYHFVDDLFKYKQGENGENIQVALVEFARQASTTQSWTNDPTDIIGTETNQKFSKDGTRGSAKRNYRDNADGTNWEAAMEEALDVLGDADDDPTFVVFITDGAPTSRGNGSSAIYPSQSSWTAYRPYYEAARTAARQVQTYKTGDSEKDNTTMFGIYAYGNANNGGEADLLDDLIYFSNNNADRPGYNGGTVEDTDNYYSASDTTGLRNAIKSIFDEIVKAMGISNVSINDGTTSNVRASSGEVSHLLTVDDTSFKYWLTVPIVGNKFKRIDFDSNTEIEYTVTDIGNGKLRISWGNNGEHVDVNGELHNSDFKYQWEGANALYNVSPPDATYNGTAVNWNLGTTIGTLLDGVKYTVSFDVWPTQETYDLISDLDNEIKTYSGLDPIIKQYLKYEDGKYTLYTNTQATLTYTDTRVSNQPQQATYTNPEPVPTDASKMTVRKLWDNQLDQNHEKVTEISLNVLKDGEKYGETIILDNKVVDANGNPKEKWADEVFISTGLMTVTRDDDGNVVSAKIREKGHNYTFQEIENGTYYWDLDVETVRPMLVNMIIDGVEQSVIKTFVKVEDNPPAIGDSNVTTLDGVTYYKIDGQVYYMKDASEAIMDATNIRRSNLNIKKTVTGDDAPADSQFKFTLTVNDYLGNDVWFSLHDENGTRITVDEYVSAEGLHKEYNTDGSFKGYYYVASGTEITVIMRKDWNLRFTNLATGTTYTFEEIEMPDNFDYKETTATSVTVPVELLPAGAVDNGNGTYTADGVTYTKVVEGNDVYYTYVGEAKITGTKTEGTIYVGNTSYQVTYTNDYTQTHLSGVKVWDDNDNNDGKRPGFINIQLIAKVDGKREASLEASMRLVSNGTDRWSFTFDDLDRYYQGKPVEYSIEEFEVEGYDVDIEQDEETGEYTITNSHTDETTTVKGTKTWSDNDNNDGKRPTSITVQLIAKVKGERVSSLEKTTTLQADNQGNWKFDFGTLPAYYKGSKIDYSIEEFEVPGYTVVINRNQETGEYTITNSHTDETTTVKGTKIWVDDDDLEGYRPTSVTVHLVAKQGNTVLSDLAATRTVTKNNDGDWLFDFGTLPAYRGGKPITYSIVEDEVANYETTTGYDETSDYPYLVINTHAPRNLDITVKKEWNEVSADGITNPFTHTYEIDVKLVGTVGETTYYEDTQTVELDENGDWSYTFRDLPEYREGVNVEYVAYEATDMKDFSVTGDIVKDDTSEDEERDHYIYTLTNKYNPGGKVDISGVKNWDDGEDQDGLRPDTITINLIAKIGNTVLPELASSTQATETGKWAYSFNNLPKKHNGEDITYTLEEVSVKGYTSVITDYNITNTHTPETVSFTISKVWDDNGNNDGLRPDSITVRLLADGVEVASRIANEENDWYCEFIGFAKYNKGNPIEYKIVEDEVKAYSSKLNTVSEGNNATNYELVNTHENETVDLTINKTWDDYDDISNIRPSEILVDILQDGNYLTTVSVTAGDNWNKVFAGFAKYHDGILYRYDVIEHRIAEYDAKYLKNGYKFDIINHHELGIGGGPQEEVEELPPQTGIAYDEYSIYKYLYIILMAVGVLGLRVRFGKDM